MNCWRVQNLVAPFLDGELPDPESEALAGHLELCPPCRELVEGVAALPEFPQISLDAAVESSLWSEFDRCLAARLMDPSEVSLSTLGGAQAVLRGDLRVPRTLAAAAAAVVAMLIGWNWTTYDRLEQLEASLGERDAIIVALQERVAETRADDSAFALMPTAGDIQVLLPANAPGATMLGSTRFPRFPYETVGYQIAAGSSPTLVR